jgi:hypothetical protein
VSVLNTTTRRSNALHADGNLVAAQVLRDLDGAVAQFVDSVVLLDGELRLRLTGATTTGLLSGLWSWLRGGLPRCDWSRVGRRWHRRRLARRSR